MPPKRVSKPDADRTSKKARNAASQISKLKKTIKVLSKTVNYSLCIPTTILANCRNLEQITSAVYQVAKAATIFNVGEIVILDLGQKGNRETKHQNSLSDAMLIASLLQYFVTPPYLVNTVFKKQYRRYFKEASKLPRLSSLPFMRHLGQDRGRYREGLAIRMSKPGSGSTAKKGKEFKQTKYISIGKAEPLELKAQLVPVNVRVTVDTVEHRVVSPQEAYGDFVGAQASYGYHVRVAKSFGSVFTECALPNGYSQAIWANSGDYYYSDQLTKHRKVETKLPYVARIVRPDDDRASAPPANVLLVCGRWDHINASFQQSKHQFDGCDGAHQFFDGQLRLPGSAPQGLVPIQDCCMISLALVATL
ncbi:hypothetical protein HG536_0A00270 [Torulaspora globosa]|uniref:Uncharacterized protein n=1 Tax=Torulaspora globosa TaxID=48254 RepID=A0A7G3Z9M4_9SACH|nr:uncharacterized protein HG536_0A00270 [Torulaspora globosa]QLL30210.1 hypothetical protein HG536_0A00270 [Torulaspora globosa]